MINVPASYQRLAVEIDGWLDLRCPEKALQRLEPMLADPGARAAGLTFRVRASVEMADYENALRDLEELRRLDHDPEWLDLTEAWCKKRVSDLSAAIACMERLLERNPRSAIGHFNLGCYLALNGQTDRALDEVTVACGIDDQFRDLAAQEPDLAALESDGRFGKLIRRPEGGSEAS